MAATPQFCQFIFQGNSGTTYGVDGYISDVNRYLQSGVNGGLARFDGGAGAGTTSPTVWIAPENVILTDFSMTTGTADTEKIRLVVNSKPLSTTLRYVPHLSTNSNRPVLRIGFKGGSQISAFQISD